MWSCEFAWASRMLYNQEDFDPMAEGRKRGSLKIHSLVPVCAAQSSSILFYSTHLYILGNKKKHIIFLYTRVVIFLCYTVIYCLDSSEPGGEPGRWSWQIHPLVDKINQVTTGKNKYCMGVSHVQWKTSIAWVKRYGHVGLMGVLRLYKV